MDTTQTPIPAPSDDTSEQKSRRQVAFYPNMNSSNKPQKPFSRSAAKRESVMALGSIEHLQHYFTKTGIKAESDPLKKPHHGMVPAIGGPSGLSIKPSRHVGRDFQLPPSPAIPPVVQPSFPPHIKIVETDPENLRPGVIEDLGGVASAWELDGTTPPQDTTLLTAGEVQKEEIDVLDVLKTTTRAVRSVRNYLMSLPDESTGPTSHQSFRPQTLSSTPMSKRQASQPNSPSDPLTRIRKSALEVLSVLREVEEKTRLPLEHDAYDAQSDHGSLPEHGTASRSASPTEPAFLDGDTSVSISFIEISGHSRPVPVWEDEVDDFNQLSEEEREKRERWDERLVLSGGWLYRQDVRLVDLAREREVVARYVNTVDEVLFGGTQDGKRGWHRERDRALRKERQERSKGRRVSAGDAIEQSEPEMGRSKRRVVSTGMLDAMRSLVVTEEPEGMETVSEEDSVDDDELPDWAKRTTFIDDPLGRLRALLAASLPSHLQALLPPAPPDGAALLKVLSAGQMLCVAYNTGVRRSRKPWGYVSKDAIHDIVALELQSSEDSTSEKNKRGWTFRRTDNLRLWAAALKLRYLIPITSPSSLEPIKRSRTPTPGDTPTGTPSISPSPSTIRFPGVTMEDSITFDAPLVARLDNGWEDMLESAVLKWVDAVVDERRGER
ncbi:hypothetical protein CERSUDRAFT_156446 [Gelatoporia subvermispora B]|uniref:Uncharacterized protein n=1 Tax=Ceriporiopsis subvermispora (strain B) TaxID=914234 RepID=M2RAB8_CERS8|nr:hypothetical protein CERSUDRAFT_156446 [Gelatoporia subvermispora B]